MHRVRGLALVAVFAVAAGAWPLPAYAPQNKPPPPQEIKIDFAKASEAAKARPAEAAGAPNALLKADLEQQARHLQWQRDYERRGWEWHLLSTQLLFGVVILIVLFGLYITYVQFRRDYSEWEQRPAANKPDTPAPPAATADATPPARAPPGATTLKLTPAGLEVTSQIVGLIVLALSLAFFFLYVKEVYPIREVDVTKQASPPARDEAPADKAGK